MNDGLVVHQLGVGPLQVNCFLIVCNRTNDAVVVDPGEDAERILRLAKNEGARIRMIVNTHGHFDHIGANRKLKETTGAELIMHQSDLQLLQNARSHAKVYGLTVDPSPEPDRFVDHGDSLVLGELTFSVFHVPGHSPGSICLLSEGHLFVGDVLFAGSVGRTDLPGGDFDTLISGIRQHLFPLPEETVVHTGHGPDTTIGRERKMNPFVGDGV